MSKYEIRDIDLIVKLSKSFLFEILGGIFIGFSVNIMTTVLLTKPDGLAIRELIIWVISILLLLSGLSLSLGKFYLQATMQKIEKEATERKKTFEETIQNYKSKIDRFMFLLMAGGFLFIIAILFGLFDRYKLLNRIWDLFIQWYPRSS